LGEKKDLTKPFPYSFTITKKNDFTLVSTTEMMGKTIVAEQVYHNYGMTSKIPSRRLEQHGLRSTRRSAPRHLDISNMNLRLGWKIF